MKRLAAIPVILLLSGCGPSFPTIDKAALQEAVAAVRVQTIKICQYIPSDESLISILTADVPFVESAVKIAQQICEAVTAEVPPVNPAQMGAERRGDENQCPMVRGTCITGQFISQAPSQADRLPEPDGPDIHPPAPEVQP